MSIRWFTLIQLFTQILSYLLLHEVMIWGAIHLGLVQMNLNIGISLMYTFYIYAGLSFIFCLHCLLKRRIEARGFILMILIFLIFAFNLVQSNTIITVVWTCGILSAAITYLLCIRLIKSTKLIPR